jgi:putative SOS response-associated peptidase YedK
MSRRANVPREKGETIRSATLVVTDANAFMTQIHDRMPGNLPPDRIGAWLDGSGGVEMLTPAPPGSLRAWPVSRRVNSSKAPKEDASLIEPIAPALAGA